MIRITLLSLLLGALALLAGLLLFFSEPGAKNNTVPVITLGANNAKVILGEATFDHEGLQLVLNAAGLGVISFTDKKIAAKAYPFLHLAIEGPAKDVDVWFTWSTDEAHENHHGFVPQNRLWRSMWLATQEMEGWTKNISPLTMAVVGKAGATIRIKELALFPPSPLRQLQAVVSDLTGYVPWNRAAMNSHTGVTPVASFYPTILVVALLLLSLLAYGFLLLIFRSKVRFSWRVVALIFLACWISLDMFWQKTLLHQVVDTYRTFSGKSPHEKLLAGPDANLYAFVTQVIPLVSPKDARIFVSSSDIYLGQRGAYFLYPFNVFWPGPNAEFPPDYWLRSGDLVLLVYPTTLRFDTATNKLALSANSAISAELVFNDRVGQLVRVL